MSLGSKLANGVVLGIAVSSGACTAAVGGPEQVGESRAALTLSATEKLTWQRTHLDHPFDRPHHVEPHASADGKFVVFIGINPYLTDTVVPPYFPQAYLYERATNTLTALTTQDDVREVGISSDGRFIVIFNQSPSVNSELGPGFHLLDRQAGTWTTILSGNNGSYQTVKLSADGSTVAFVSGAPNLVSDDKNNIRDLFLWNRVTGKFSRVPDPVTGGELKSSEIYLNALSADGNVVGFTTQSFDFKSDRCFAYDRRTGKSERLGIAPNGYDKFEGMVRLNDLSADGRYALLDASGTGHDRAVVYDRVTRMSQEVDRLATGESADPSSGSLALSPDGRFVLLATFAGNLDPTDSNQLVDAYLSDRLLHQISRITERPDWTSSRDQTTILGSSLPATNDFVTFSTRAQVVPGDADDGGHDVYLRKFTPDPISGDVLNINEYEEFPQVVTTNGSLRDHYENAVVTNVPSFAFSADATGKPLTVKGTASFRGRSGGAATLQIDIKRAGSTFSGYVALSDPNVRDWDSRKRAGASVDVQALSSDEYLVTLEYPRSDQPLSLGPNGIKLTIKKAAIPSSPPGSSNCGPVPSCPGCKVIMQCRPPEL